MTIQRSLTPRQRTILRSVARGRTNKDIARDLGISEQGVKVHISRLLERYGAENRVELVSVTRAWADSDQNGYTDLATDIATIRTGLTQANHQTAAVGQAAGRNGHGDGHAVLDKANGHSAPAASDLSSEVRRLREVLAEINVAVKLAREMPADANVLPIVDSIHARVSAALDQSARLDALVDGLRLRDRWSTKTAS